MKPIISSVGSDRMLLNLTPDEKSNPLSLLEEFCTEYTPGQIRDLMNKDFLIQMTNDSYNNPEDRSKLIFRFQAMLKLVEACYILASEHTRQNKTAA